MINILSRLNYIQRLIGTALSFILFGLGGIFLSVFLFPPLHFFIRSMNKKKKVFRAIISFFFRVFIKFMELVGVIEFSIIQKEILNNEKKCILIANHPTLIDVIAIMAYCPNACCVVKASLWNNILIKFVLLSAGYIPNIDTEILLQRCKESIDNDDVLIIFPEGTRTTVGKSLKFKRGAAHLIFELKCSVRFVELSCFPPTLTKGQSWYKIPKLKARLTLCVKEKITFNEFFDSALPRPLAVRRLNQALLEQYCSNV